jgi:hypothetical protein
MSDDRKGMDIESLIVKKSENIRIGNDVSYQAPMTINVDQMHFHKNKGI